MTGPQPRQGVRKIAPHMLSTPGGDLPPVSVDLSSNESAYGPGESAIAAARSALAAVERYAEDAPRRLSEGIGRRFGLDPAKIAVGHGSDDLLARLARVYLEPGSELVRSRNGYLKFPNYAFANDALPVAAPDENLCASVDGILSSVTPRTRAVFLANPDNPSGSYLSGSEIRRLHAGLPDHVLLVLDSAYAEYVDAADYEPADRLVDEATNVVMTRTFSKIFGLAGMRLGWLYGPPDVVDLIVRIGLTFPVSSAGTAAALAGLADRAHTDAVFEANARSRRSFARRLSGLGLQVYPSQANFVLVRFADPGLGADAAYAFLRLHGIAARRFASPAYHDFVRITLGRDSELALVGDALERFIAGGAMREPALQPVDGASERAAGRR
jgi:histidinol-phosphate aminotransferase